MRKNRGKFNAMIESGSGSKSGTQKYQGLGHRKRIRPAFRIRIRIRIRDIIMNTIRIEIKI